MWRYVAAYVVIINVIAIVVMLYDKKQAKKHKRRVPEKKLFLLAIIYGSLGILLGMYAFRHKTKHASFVYGIPSILFIQLFLSLYLFKKLFI